MKREFGSIALLSMTREVLLLLLRLGAPSLVGCETSELRLNSGGCIGHEGWELGEVRVATKRSRVVSDQLSYKRR